MGAPHISVVPTVPKDEGEKLLLIEDLTWIACEGLLAQPWSLRSKDMAREFLQECSNKWEGTIRKDSNRWIAETWTEVYNFPKEGRGQASWTDKFAQGKFSVPVNPKDGYIVVDYKDPREKRV